jgi:hypothetical protein
MMIKFSHYLYFHPNKSSSQYIIRVRNNITDVKDLPFRVDYDMFFCFDESGWHKRFGGTESILTKEYKNYKLYRTLEELAVDFFADML